ncbi:DUF4129 domain-containing transglutaminase family protein [Paenibacillus sp. J22TS3]|uniref:DUF4129 domain-containing transglutaminase family protein n=1 Tax=Paenibacillus sp. J22TS3 TaxID=2807192 RepID=UPI001B1A83D3|nr:transglutaminase domain-containing protein [Paenibacillus sp. J22TS3]GIP20587.1 protease [Paenibacillus sp. J22TS3]
MNSRFGKIQYSWYFISCIVWVLIMSAQWISFVKPIWYEETSVLVLDILIAAAAAEVVLPFRRWLKWGVKIAAVVLIHYWVLQNFNVLASDGPLLPVGIIRFISQVEPYIWFSLPAWGLFELAIRLSDYRGFILLFTGMNILAFAILDSFTSYYLWPQVAWTVFAGLSWLVCFHFRKYQMKYPQGWRHLRLYPFRVVTNIVIIFCCILLLGISMPEVSPLLTDPYSAWQNIQGNKYEKQDEPESKPQDSASGYSRDDSKLGGGFNFDFSTVMTVTSPKRTYWRGETRSFYTGTGWLSPSNPDDQRYQFGQNVGVNGPGSELGRKVKTERVEQTFVMAGKRTYPVLFGAYSISKINLLKEEERQKGPDAVWNWRDEFMAWNGFGLTQKHDGYPTTYKVVSQMPIIPLEKLSKASYDSLYQGANLAKYTQLNPEFPDRVKQLAKKVTAEGKTPYEKMVLLQDYLKVNFNYTNTPDLSLKKHDDLVEGFLFDIKEGYCDYFSTSMVVMARSIGIPARWVKGFSSGHQNIEGPEHMNREPEGPYTVTNADAHSWAEVYFGEDYGWVTFEATPGFDLPLNVSEDKPAVAPVKPEVSPPVKKTPEPASKQEDSSSYIGWLAAALGTAIVIAAGYLAWKYRNALYYTLLRLRKGRELTSGEKIITETNRWLGHIRKWGFGREAHETLREVITRWKQDAPMLEASFNELLAQFEKAKYSPEQVNDQDWRKIQSMLQDITRTIKKIYS